MPHDPSDDDAGIDLCATDDVWEGAGLRVVAPGFGALAVFNVDGRFFVIDDTCPHGAASLSEGYVEDGQVECPWHAGRFCIRSGKPLSGPVNVPVRTYPARVAGGRVRLAPGAPPPDPDPDEGSSTLR